MNIVTRNAKRIISEKRFKQSALAPDMNMSVKDWNNLLCGRKRFDPDLIPALAKVLGVDIADLFAVERDTA